MPNVDSGQALQRSIWPMPGGAAHYADNLHVMLNLCEQGLGLEALAQAITAVFPQMRSQASAVRYVRLTLLPLGLVEISGDQVQLTMAGRQILLPGGDAVLAHQLKARISGITEILTFLGEDQARIGVIHAHLNNLGFDWRSDWQVRYRLRWMETATLIERSNYRHETRTRLRYPEYVLLDT